MSDIKVGDWVEVKAPYDIPPAFRHNKPTTGRVAEVVPADGPVEALAIVWVPIGDDDIDEHSQSVPYPIDALVKVEKPNA